MSTESYICRYTYKTELSPSLKKVRSIAPLKDGLALKLQFSDHVFAASIYTSIVFGQLSARRHIKLFYL